MRLDKFLCDSVGLSRSEAKKAVSHGEVCVNGKVIRKPDEKLDEASDEVLYKGEKVIFESNVYYMLNKPQGVICANFDTKDSTVLDLFKNEKKKNLSCVGRLDKDTNGLLIVTDDGVLNHKITSPSTHMFKDYLVNVDHPLSASDIEALKEGVNIGDDEITRPARVKILSEEEIILSISEGRFHQVKRMLHAVGNEVKALKRISIGPLKLDEGLPEGSFRRLTEHELEALINALKG